MALSTTLAPGVRCRLDADRPSWCVACTGWFGGVGLRTRPARLRIGLRVVVRVRSDMTTSHKRDEGAADGVVRAAASTAARRAGLERSALVGPMTRRLATHGDPPPAVAA